MFGSYYEGFSNSIIEALSFGVPVVAYNARGGFNEIINSDNGRLVESDNLNSYKKSIVELIMNPLDKNKIIEGVKSKYSKEAIVSQYEEMFISVL